MEFLPLREVPLADATEREYDRWTREIGDRIADEGVDRNALVREVLTSLFHPRYVDADPRELPSPLRLALLQMDPRNVTLEPEYYHEVDVAKYARVKPLQWLWEMFDRSILGENVALGVRFRRMLARHIFGSVGRDFKAFSHVRFSFGYNLEVGNDVVVHRGVLLDDRGGIRIGNDVTIADCASIFSHTHALADNRFIESPRTVLDDGVRVTYHATVLAGVHLHDGAMLGSMAVATRDVDRNQLALGIPAAPKLDRPGPDRRPEAPRTRDPLAEPVRPPRPIGIDPDGRGEPPVSAPPSDGAGPEALDEAG